MRDFKARNSKTYKGAQYCTPYNRARPLFLKDRLSKKTIFIGAISILLFYIFISIFPPVIRSLKNIANTPPSVFAFFRESPKELKQSDGKTYGLLLGIDKRSTVPYAYRGKGGVIQKNGFLTDTIIVIGFDHKDHSVTMLSLPRDLWVKVPAFGELLSQQTKINAVYSLGEIYNYEEGGLGLIKEVVSEVLGIPIHYGARIDFDGFRRGIDLLGGVDIEVERAFDDYMYPREGFEDASWEARWEHIHFNEGLQHMDGETALKFVRSRHALGPEGSDFSRAKRQQKVIVAAKNKALSLSTLINPKKVGELIEIFGQTIETNIDLKEAPLFYEAAKKVDSSSIFSYVLGGNEGEENLLINPPEEVYGAWVLVPRSGDWTEIRGFVKGVFDKR